MPSYQITNSLTPSGTQALVCPPAHLFLASSLFIPAYRLFAATCQGGKKRRQKSAYIQHNANLAQLGGIVPDSVRLTNVNHSQVFPTSSRACVVLADASQIHVHVISSLSSAECVQMAPLFVHVLRARTRLTFLSRKNQEAAARRQRQERMLCTGRSRAPCGAMQSVGMNDLLVHWCILYTYTCPALTSPIQNHEAGPNLVRHGASCFALNLSNLT